MGLIGCLVVTKLIECWWLLFINLRQFGKVNRIHQIPSVLANVYTDNHIRDSRIKANKRIISDMITTVLDTISYCFICTGQDVARLWNWCQTVSAGDEILAYVLFAGGAAVVFWMFGLPGSFIKTFVIEHVQLDIPELQEWLGDSAQRLIHLSGDLIPAAIAVHVVSQLTRQPALILALLAALYHAAIFLYLRFTSEPQESVFWSMPNSKLKLRLAVIASLLGFSPQHVFTIDNWCEGDDWRPNIEGEPGPKGLAASLVVTFYREEAGGGHAKSFDVPEIMAYAAHGLSFCKHMYPVAMAGIVALKTVVKMLIAFKLMEKEYLFQPFGFKHEPPMVVSLFLAYFIILSPMDKAWRYGQLWGSRSFYKAGDRLVAGLGLGRQLARALAKAEAEAGVTPAADYLYLLYYSSRPSLVGRIVRLRNNYFEP